MARKPATRSTTSSKAAAARPTRSSAKRRAAAGRTGTGSGIKIRMYRQGLGDCFLITLTKQDGSPYYIMIDCGVVLGTKDPGPRMTAVVQSIIAQTKGRVDLLVVTHEHWDHLSGFIQAQALFATSGDNAPGKLKVGSIWFAWTEDPSDVLATRLRKERAERVRKLAAFAQAAAGKGLQGVSEPVVDGVSSLVEFFGATGGGGKTTSDALKIVRQLSPKIRYVRPSDDPTMLPGIPNIRVYALGPPVDEAALRKTDSTTEVYRELAGQGAAGSFFAAGLMNIEGMAGDDEVAVKEEIERNMPFDSRVARRLPQDDEASTQLAPSSFLSRYYFGSSSDPYQPDQSWRRIDGDWMGAAAEFALQLDSATNNTSLVLALDLIGRDEVLLFAADAQIGNWLSWQGLSWSVDGKTVTGEDLLRRTVFYKVGHHGSHNATLKAKGLELMRLDDFVAFIPVNHAMAVKKHWGKMPLPKLVAELQRRTRGRLVRADENYAIPADDDGTAAAFARQLKVDDLFYEWQVPPD